MLALEVVAGTLAASPLAGGGFWDSSLSLEENVSIENKLDPLSFFAESSSAFFPWTPSNVWKWDDLPEEGAIDFFAGESSKPKSPRISSSSSKSTVLLAPDFFACPALEPVLPESFCSPPLPLMPVCLVDAPVPEAGWPVTTGEHSIYSHLLGAVCRFSHEILFLVFLAQQHI